MSLKIQQVEHDRNGTAKMSGLFDGEPFRLFVEGGKWLFRTAKGWTHAQDALQPSSTAEARSFAYGAVASFRNEHKMI